MPVCKLCHNKWSWKQTIKKTMTLNSEMSCPYCENKQYQSKKSKMKSSFLTSIILLPLLIQIFFDVPGAILLSLIPILGVIAFLSFPFLVELSNKEEFPFEG